MSDNSFAKKVAKAVEKTVPCTRIGIAVVGLEVPHAHVHLLPLHSMDDMRFTGVYTAPSSEEMQALAAAIVANF